MKEFNKTLILTPVYEDNEACTMLLLELNNIFNTQLHVIIVDDGSLKTPVASKIFKNTTLDGTIIKLVKNVGHQSAIGIGLCYINDNIHNYEKLVIMDSDGEDSPKGTKQLIENLENYDVDVVLAQRKNRKDN